MPGLLGRSKSLRLLRKGGHDGPHPRETDNITPPFARSQVDVRRLKEASVPTSGGRVETPDMLRRPQTSGGVGDRPPPFHKVRPFQYQENNSFDFAPSSPAKPNGVFYAAEVYESTEGVIGIALGSPTMASHWNVASPPSDFTTHTQGPVTHISANHHSIDPYPQTRAVDVQQDAPKPKLSRWKSLFKKTGPPPRPQEKEPFYQLAKSTPPARADSHHDEEAQDEEQSVQSPASYSYDPSIRESRKLPKGQPQPTADSRPRALTSSSTQPRPKTSLLRSASNAISPRFPKKPPPPPVPQVAVSDDSKPLSSSPQLLSAEKPLLDVAIPEVHMERYSVMFSSLLQQNGASSTPQNPTVTTTASSPVQQNHDTTPTSTLSSSLLQRRQAEQLKPLDRLSIKNPSQNSSLKPQRRATSPGHAKSPSGNLSLFPSPNTSRAPSPRSLHASVHRPRPVQRSRTEPANKSPRHSAFARQDEGNIGLALTPSTPQTLTTPLTGTSMTTSPSPSSRRNSFDSEGGVEELTVMRAVSVHKNHYYRHQANPTATIAQPSFKPTATLVPADEPEWEILPKRSVSTKITKAEALRSHPSVREPPTSAPSLDVIATASPVTLIRSPSSARRVSQHALSPPTSAKAAQGASSGTATVGIARSISVSRTNSPLLTPGSAGAGAARTSTIDGRLGDHRALTPTLVDLGKNRRSQRVQLVDA